MVIENILQNEILEINKEIIKKRVSLEKLLKEPFIESSNKVIQLDKNCLERIAKNCNLPKSQIFLPITFFIPAGSYEGYILSKNDAEVVSALEFDLHLRNDRYWLPKYQIRKLIRDCPGIFQSVIVP
jgi:uncharacterized protein (UPF0216 family)